MDDKGFIFTTDAVLGLVVVIVFTASLITYFALPAYNGEEHQHLQALADSALSVMEQDGSLRLAAVKKARGDTSGAQLILNSELEILIPDSTAYNITVGEGSNTVSASDDRGLLYATDTVTKVKVISGPEEGWMGRAWYKLEEVQFVNQQQNVTTTVWNFHNWLSNFSPWNSRSKLATYDYWGIQNWNRYGGDPYAIQFSIPDNATILGGTFLLGANSHHNDWWYKGQAYGANVHVNSIDHIISSSNFTFLNLRPNSYETMYNYQGNLTASELQNGANSFYINFRSPVDSYSDLPWFSMLATYTTNLALPQGITTSIDNFTDCAGVAVPSAQDLDGDGVWNEYGFSYNLKTGQKTFFNQLRSVNWNSYVNRNSIYSDGTPFVLTGIPHGASNGCAVSKVVDINIPDGSRLFDSYVVINSYGGVDNTLVEVWDGSQWQTVFNSFDNSQVSDGYGNNPGIIYLRDYLKTGNNKVRVTVWDQAPGNDYDFVGLTNCYAVTTYSKLPIKWENFAFTSEQSDDRYLSKTRQFTIGSEAKQALLFVGVGTSTRHITVDYNNGTVLYDSDTVPFVLDLAALDASVAKGHVITSGTSGNYTLKPGNYTLRVTVTGPANAWESGDNDANAALFSGTRVAVIYPKFLQNIWETSYASTASEAEYNAGVTLNKTLRDAGITVDPSLIRTEAMYTGDLPNAIPVRLNLWKQ
ncbi:hypothetical protein [Methanobacterium congolense]|uniref:Uncharacterized protein n=1 Tax=Methanobacterium congolense TaxID=118062 RepID=A0A1D3L254_9EURY|nr:hypothetical protein [Methanobacterium congolense]SCG85648.1 putative protein [Methanobacterium congolense]